MTVNDLTTIITSVGFPIVMCLMMAYYIKYSNDQHKAEMDAMTEAVQNNTLMLQRLCDTMEGGKK